MLIAKAFNLNGIAGGYYSSLTSSRRTIAKARKTKRNVPDILPGTFLFNSLIRKILYCIFLRILTTQKS